MKITEKLDRFINQFSKNKTPLLVFLGIFLGFVACRIFIEYFLATSSKISAHEIIIAYLHDVYFFSISLLIIWIFISLITKTNPKNLSCIFVWGTFLIIIPPVIDMIFTGGSVFWSFYILGGIREILVNFLTFFSHLPSGIVYFGTKISFFVSILFIAFFVFMKTKNYYKSILGLLGSYIILFFMSAFPSFLFFIFSILSKDRDLDNIRAYHIAQFFGFPQKIMGISPQVVKYSFAYNLNLVFFPLLICILIIFFFLISYDKFSAIRKNLRLPQVIYHSGLFFIGIGLGYLDFSKNFSLDIFSILAVVTILLCVWLSWIASVIINDTYDFKIDTISNPQRPLPKKLFNIDEYIGLGIFCFILAFIGALSLGYTFAILIFVYQFLAWLYSGSTFRLKKIPFFATFISAVASLMILFLGYVLISDDQTIHTLSWRIILLLLITYTISLPIKDFKDIEGDRSDKIWTIPVIFGEKKARLIVAINIFISYILSVFFLSELSLFWWALLFGIITFLIVVNEKIKPRKIPAWVLVAVFTYSLILIKIVF